MTTGTTQPAVPAAHRTDEASIDLGRSQGRIAAALWTKLSAGLTEPWLTDLATPFASSETLDEVSRRWLKALDAAAEAPRRAEAAATVRRRLLEHLARTESNRGVYSHTTPQEMRHRYWPTGKYPDLEQRNLFSMTFCRRTHRFITRQTKIASAGSCFALELGRTLRTWGYNYFLTEPGPDDLSEDERQARGYGTFSARYGKLFNTPSLRQLIERGVGEITLDPYVYEHGDVWRDPYRDGVTFSSPEAHAASLPAFEAALRRTVSEAEVFVLTLGVNEVWSFVHDGTYLSRVPWAISPALLDRRVLSVDENVGHLQRLRDTVTRHNPGIRLIVTVSPIPLLATFRSADTNIVAANCHSKSVLRVAAEAVADRNENITYFPAYEAVMYGTRNPFIDDGRHVSSEAVHRVMTMFRDTFCVEE